MSVLNTNNPLVFSQQARRLTLYEEDSLHPLDTPKPQAKRPSLAYGLGEVLKRYQWLILLSLFVGVLLGVAYSFMAPPIYRATVQLQLIPENVVKVKIPGSTTTEAIPAVDMAEFYRTQYELLKSRTLARKVIDQLNLYPNNESKESKLATPFFAKELEEFQTLIFGKDATVKQQVGNYPVEEEFLRDVSIEPVKDSSLVKVHYDSSNPETAKTIANEIASKFISMSLEQRLDASTYAKDFIDDQLAQTKSKLDESEAKLVQYTKDSGFTAENDKAAADRLAQLEAAVTQAEQARIAAQSAYENPTAGEEDKTDLFLLEHPTIKSLKDSYAKLQAEYQEQLQIYKPEYPTMLDLQKQMDVINKQIAESQKEAKNEIKAKYAATQQEAKAKYVAAQQQEASLRKELETQKSALLALREKGTGYAALQREVDTNRSLYDGLLQRIKEVGAATDIAKSNVTIVDPAIVPYFPFSPDIKSSLLWGSLLGLLSGLVLTLILAVFDDRIRTKEALEALLGMPVIGLIPYAKIRANKKQPPQIGSMIPHSPMSEAFRALRTHLSFASHHGVPRVLHITSATHGEGKSTTCINLAASLAQAGKQVLLVDCDLRKPSLHVKLQIDNSEGMVQFLTTNTPVKQFIRTTQVPNLYLISAGALASNPTELLLNDRMHELFKLIEHDFDTIILDSPPVLGLADALILSKWASATVLVTACAESKAKLLLDTYEQLRQVRARIIGSILTKIKSKHGNIYKSPQMTKYLRLENIA